MVVIMQTNQKWIMTQLHQCCDPFVVPDPPVEDHSHFAESLLTSLWKAPKDKSQLCFSGQGVPRSRCRHIEHHLQCKYTEHVKKANSHLSPWQRKFMQKLAVLYDKVADIDYSLLDPWGCGLCIMTTMMRLESFYRIVSYVCLALHSDETKSTSWTHPGSSCPIQSGHFTRPGKTERGGRGLLRGRAAKGTHSYFRKHVLYSPFCSCFG